MKLLGGRKMALGILYLVGGIGCIETAILTKADAAVLASVAGAFLSLATGLGVIVWGNIQAKRAANGA